MVGATTDTTANTTTPLSPLSMNLSPSPQIHSAATPSQVSASSPSATMQAFTPGQCLFCPKTSPDFADSVAHMQKAHGLFVAQKQHLIVDLETLFKYLHLVIFGYRECIQCGTQRATVQAVQQHMTGKGHCRFDISDPESEFAEFYDFSEVDGDAESGNEDDEYDKDEYDRDDRDDRDDKGNRDGKDDEDDEDKSLEETTSYSRRQPLVADEDSIRLPSGRIISKRSSAQVEPPLARLRLRTRTVDPQLEDTTVDEDAPSAEEADTGTRDTRVMSKREKRERATMQYQLTNMSKNDRNSLMHLSASQQHSLLAAQLRQADKVQKQERRRQGKIDRKGNKNLYAYWATETPVYLCG